MKKNVTLLLSVVFFFLTLASVAGAITFDEVANGTVDPTIGEISFSAGSSSTFSDTMVDDFVTPGDPYLMSGNEDDTGFGLNSGNYFLAAALNKSGYLFATVTLDLYSDFVDPTQIVEFFVFFGNSTTGVRDGQIFTFENEDHGPRTISITNTVNYDYFGIISPYTADGDSSSFNIDNFLYTTKQPGGPINVVPEPSTLALLGLGLVASAAVWRKRKPQ